MRVRILLSIWVGSMLLSGLFGQALIPTPSGLVFQDATEDFSRSVFLQLKNPHNEAVTIQEIRVYDTYGESAFRHNGSMRTIEAGDSIKLIATFAPRHNILHDQEMMIITDKGALAVDLKGQGIYTNSYYSSTQNLSEEALKSALKTLLNQGAVNLGYNGARNEMFMVIDNQAVNGLGAGVSTLECVYTGLQRTGYTSRTQAQDQLNTEHTWPRSLFGNDPSDLRKSDLFHIFPTKINANATRANHPFGVVNNPSWQDGGSKFGNNTFEPRDTHKGPVSRAMFYYVLRYNNQNNFLNNQETILRQWHSQYLPDSVEIRRNEAIYAVQRNRNPLIDYPQLLERISSFSTTSQAPAIYQYDLSEDSIQLGRIYTTSPIQYDWVWVNTGNEPISIQNLRFDLPAVSAPTFRDTTIEPGEDLPIRLLIQPSQNGSSTVNMELELNQPGPVTIKVPISYAYVVSRDNRPASSVKAYWDPIAQQLILPATSTWETPLTLSLHNLEGKTIYSTEIVRTTSTNRLSIPKVSSGIVFLRLQSGGQAWEQKIYIGMP